jgi:UDP-GlcNAc:undecaprenyl-phosphate/decaprenyl-phosphate GlcNAc-1-phosphate transferase
MLLLAFLVAVLLSVALVPLLMQHAQRFGFIDAPDPRKVHVTPIPRIGGLAMVVGAAVPILVWLDLNPQLLAFLGGVLIITVFGVWDDRADLDYRLKFAGQFGAAILVTVVGDVVIRNIPFGPVGGLPDLIAVPLTILFLVGITNAVNLADGLDGLASGIALLSAGVVALLAYLAEGDALLLLALAVSGAICGFLRYNTHPASVFMGDTGSQFLGYTLGVMVVMLTQDVNPAASPVLLVLILGLPILDTLSVMIQRIREGRSPFSADRNHLHHKLLASGLRHYEAVASIYILQGLFVGAALFLRYESDFILVSIYLAACAAVVLFIRTVRYVRLDSTRPVQVYRFDQMLKVVRQHVIFREGPMVFLMGALPLLLLGGAASAVFIPWDFGVLAAIAFVLLAVRLALGYRAWFLFLRLLIFVAIAFVTYLFEVGPPSASYETLRNIEYVYFGLLAFAVVLVVRYRLADTFKITPMDFLVILAMLSIGVIPEDVRETYHLVPVIVKLVLLFYGAELILKTMKSRWSLLPLSSLAALGILAVRGLLGQ